MRQSGEAWTRCLELLTSLPIHLICPSKVEGFLYLNFFFVGSFLLLGFTGPLIRLNFDRNKPTIYKPGNTTHNLLIFHRSPDILDIFLLILSTFKKNHDLNLIATTNFSPNYFKLPIWYTMMKRIFIILFLTYVVIFVNNALFHLSMLRHSPRCFGWCRGCLIGFVRAFCLHLIFMWFTLWWFLWNVRHCRTRSLGCVPSSLLFMVSRYLNIFILLPCQKTG